MKRTNQLLAKSDTSPKEQIAKQSSGQLPGNEFQKNLATLLSRLKKESVHHYVIVATLAATGARITEVLEIDGSRIASNGSVLILGKKGSKNFWFYSGELAEYFQSRAGQPGPIWPGINRKQIWQLLVEAGIYLEMPRRKRKSVCHAFRHQKAAAMREVTKSKEDIASGLNHRSYKSQEHYGK